MESVEVWMWIIAGLLIGGIIFAGGFNMLAKYTRNAQSNLAQDNFELLKSNIDNICVGGRYSQEINNYVFPEIVNNITIYQSSEDKLSKMCIDITKEGTFCEDLDICNTTMDTIDFTQKKSIFDKVLKALRKNRAKTIEFSIKKIASKRVNVSTRQVLSKS